jgi:type VI secretion system protein ImpB
LGKVPVRGSGAGKKYPGYSILAATEIGTAEQKKPRFGRFISWPYGKDGVMTLDSYQNEVPKARVNIKLDLHTGGAQKKVELPLKLMVMGDYSNGKEQRPLSERGKININKNNVDSVLGEFSPGLKLVVENTLPDDAADTAVELSFQRLKDFEPEQVARQVPQLRALLAMRNLLRDLKSNLLDNVTFRHELERILKDDALSDELRAELAALAPSR